MQFISISSRKQSPFEIIVIHTHNLVTVCTFSVSSYNFLRKINSKQNIDVINNNDGIDDATIIIITMQWICWLMLNAIISVVVFYSSVHLPCTHPKGQDWRRRESHTRIPCLSYTLMLRSRSGATIVKGGSKTLHSILRN